MAVQDHVRNPLEWAWDHLKQTGHAVEATAHTMEGAWEDRDTAPPKVQRIASTMLDLPHPFGPTMPTIS